MIWILGAAMIAGIKVLLTKGIALCLVLLLFFVKGKQLTLNRSRWDDFFLQLSPRDVQRYAIAIYLIAAGIAAGISYFIFVRTGYSHSLELSVLLFVGGLMATGRRWHTKGKDDLLRRYQEIPTMILEKREKEISEE